MLIRFITILLCVIGLTAGPMQAQEQQEDKFFLSRQGCDDPYTMTRLVIEKYGEQPLFRAQGLQFHISGQNYTSDMMYFVNQDTGTWSLISLYADGTACMVATGRGFTPYSGPDILSEQPKGDGL